MAELVRLRIDGVETSVKPRTTVAAAIAMTGKGFIRRSVSGEPRGPICGMGVCFECRATVDGTAQSRTCQLFCVDGMEVRTDA